MKKLKQDHEYNSKSGTRHISLENSQLLYAKYFKMIYYLLQKHWCHYYCIIFKDEESQVIEMMIKLCLE